MLETRRKIDRALADGVGGLRFVARSPPGLGRLVRVPFYAIQAIPGFDALNGVALPVGAGTASLTHPVVCYTPAILAANGASPALILQTPQVPWVQYRVVGFEASWRIPPVPDNPGSMPCFQRLQVGGGETLFVNEEYAPISAYLMGQDGFAGLRDYPVVVPPNQVQVTTQVVQAATSTRPILFSCNLVVETLWDDQFGAHIPGPYARRGAMVRSTA
jgi:hypothetical protein